MPFAALRPCSAPGCRALVRNGRCPAHEAQRRSQLAKADKRPNARRRGAYDYDWEKLRRAHLAQNPDCMKCGAPANTVDHWVAWQNGSTEEEERQAMRLDPGNLVSMCRSCHSRKTVLVDGGFGRARR